MSNYIVTIRNLRFIFPNKEASQEFFKKISDSGRVCGDDSKPYAYGTNICIDEEFCDMWFSDDFNCLNVFNKQRREDHFQ